MVNIIRWSRVFRWIVRLFLLVFTLSLSTVGFLGGFSAVTILNPDSYNVNVPDGPVVVNFNVSDPSSMQVILPFNITNAGVYDLTNIGISFQVSMTYEDKLLGNASTTVNIFDKSHNYGTVVHGGFLKDSLSGNSTDGFIIANIPPLVNINTFTTTIINYPLLNITV
ncbi:MAG: hypothetical protein ACTSQW_09285 [Promethearchaeota archaeon]